MLKLVAADAANPMPFPTSPSGMIASKAYLDSAQLFPSDVTPMVKLKGLLGDDPYLQFATYSGAGEVVLLVQQLLASYQGEASV